MSTKLQFLNVENRQTKRFLHCKENAPFKIKDLPLEREIP